MIIRKTLKTAVLLLTTCLLLVGVVASPVFAIEPHENPEAIEEVFSATSLFDYLGVSLDSLLLLDAANVKALLSNLGFANIPEDLELAVSDFELSGINLSLLLRQVDADLQELVSLGLQLRIADGLAMVDKMLNALNEAVSSLSQMEQSTDVVAERSQVFRATILSALRQVYEEVLFKLVAARDLILNYEELATEIAESLGVDLEDLLKLSSTNLLEIAKLLGINFDMLPGLEGSDLMEILELLGINPAKLSGLTDPSKLQ